MPSRKLQLVKKINMSSSDTNYGKCLFHSLPHPEFPEYLVEWKVPLVRRGGRGGGGFLPSVRGVYFSGITPCKLLSTTLTKKKDAIFYFFVLNSSDRIYTYVHLAIRLV